MKFLILIATFIFVPLVVCQVRTNISLQYACPVSTPYLCPNSQCVADLSTCPVDNCTGLTPYQCSDASCAISSIYCNCLGIVCSDGSCKTTIDECPLLDTCPELFPRRCPDGSCDVWNSTCANHTGPTCPFGLELCLDGICRTPALCDALPFQGCPYFECSDGTCTNNYTNCLCPTDHTKVVCCDASCVPIETLCAVTAPAFISPMNVTLTMDPALANTIVVPSSSNISTKVVSITLPPGTVNSVQSSNGSINTLTVQGVSTSKTINTTVLVNNVSVSAKVLSVPISVSFGTNISVVNNPVTLSFPAVNTNENSMCVAVLSENGTWTCVDNTDVVPTANNSYVVTANVSHFSIYAVIKKPSCFPSGSQSAQAFCAGQTWTAGTIGYFCANNGQSFYTCLGGGLQLIDNIQNCARGTKCPCCSGQECSNNNAETPCHDFA